MAYFLAKTEPGTYSAAQLEKDRRTVWDGVTNPQAVRAIRDMRPGDRVFIYHSGGESSIVAITKVTGQPAPDPKNAKSWVVELEYAGKVDPPVALSEIKQSGEFTDWALVRQGRLSTMAVPDSFIEWLRRRNPGLKL